MIDFQYVSTESNFELISLLVNFHGAINDQIWLPIGQMIDFEQWPNGPQFDLITFFINFICGFSPILDTNYNLLEAMQVISKEQC